MSIRLDNGFTKEDLKKEVREFTHPVDTLLPIDKSVHEALATLRHKEIRHHANYYYAVDQQNHLVGIASTRQLLFADPDAPIRDIMSQKVIKIEEGAPLAEALHRIAEKQLLALPVVDKENILKGIFEVHTEPMVFSEEEAIPSKIDQEIFQLIGFSLEQSKMSTSLQEYRYRMPWLLCNMIGGFACAAIAGIYQETLDSIVILALFIPLVLALSESISMQSMTLSLQFLQQKKMAWNQITRRVWTEWKTGLLLGLTSMVCVAGGYLLLEREWSPLVAVGVSVFLSMFLAATIGTITPIIFHALRWDPKVAVGPIVLTLSDIVATSIYLSFSTWWLIG